MWSRAGRSGRQAPESRTAGPVGCSGLVRLGPPPLRSDTRLYPGSVPVTVPLHRPRLTNLVAADEDERVYAGEAGGRRPAGQLGRPLVVVGVAGYQFLDGSCLGP